MIKAQEMVEANEIEEVEEEVTGKVVPSEHTQLEEVDEIVHMEVEHEVPPVSIRRVESDQFDFASVA